MSLLQSLGTYQRNEWLVAAEFPPSLKAGEEITGKISIKNPTDYDATVVVSVSLPWSKSLYGTDEIHLAPHDYKTISFPEDFPYVSGNNKMGDVDATLVIYLLGSYTVGATPSRVFEYLSPIIRIPIWYRTIFGIPLYVFMPATIVGASAITGLVVAKHS